MLKKIRIESLLSIILFAVLIVMGSCLAFKRPLWNDEYYSLISSTLGNSYASILGGGVNEGNNSPLFYFLQKLLCDAFSYHPPASWMNGHWEGVYPWDQFFLRLPAVIFMSAGLSAVFYFFYRRNSLALAVYALAVTMSTSLFWFHWTESRPYAGWFALSFFQIMTLLRILETPREENRKLWTCLILIHWLLALISNVSGIQILAAGVTLWVFHRPKLILNIPLILLPIGICLFYYLHAPHYAFFFVDDPMALINANIPKDRLFLIFLSAVILLFHGRSKEWWSFLEMKYLVFFILTLGGFGLVLLKLKLSQMGIHQGFQVSSRYFLSLTPLGIMGVVIFSNYVFGSVSSRIWKCLVVLILAVFLSFRFYKVFQQANITLKFHFHTLVVQKVH